jgi:hypothetical protein
LSRLIYIVFYLKHSHLKVKKKRKINSNNFICYISPVQKRLPIMPYGLHLPIRRPNEITNPNELRSKSQSNIPQRDRHYENNIAAHSEFDLDSVKSHPGWVNVNN